MNTPKIRFKGFKDDWEQRKLGDVFKEYSEKHHEELPALTIVQGGGTIFREESDRSLQYDKSNLSGYKMVKKDDFIVHLRSFEGGLEKANSDGIISPAYHTMHGDNVDSRFYYPYFRSYDFINRKLVAHVYGIRDGRSIDIDGMKSIEIPYTSYEEQKTIGDYLDSLDHLITLHQRKCDETKQLKKFMLQKMFPENGEKNPEIRFEGFTDDWEQRKWIDTVDISTEMVNPASGEYDEFQHIAPGNIESFTGRILDNVKTVKEEQLISGKFRFRPGDVVYGKINPQLGKYFYASTDGLTSADAYVLNGKNGLTQEFLFSLLQTVDFFKYSISVSKRSGMPKINRDELNAYSFFAPDEAEQKKIGTFLLDIDHLITLHQRKCEKLKELKKFMLQNMFV